MSNVRRLRRRTRNRLPRLGAAVVEFAVVAPLFILLTMGMIEMGRVVMVKQILINASREGARLAALPGTTSSDVSTLVQSDLSGQTINGAAVNTVPSTLASAVAGTPVTVKVSIPAAAITWIPNPMFTTQTLLEAETTMRRESQ